MSVKGIHFFATPFRVDNLGLAFEHLIIRCCYFRFQPQAIKVVKSQHLKHLPQSLSELRGTTKLEFFTRKAEHIV